MNALQVRRATVEDLPQLHALWRLEQLPGEELEKRLTEFQVVAAEGEVIGALGLCLLGEDALLYGEAIGRPELGDTMRQQLWARFETLTMTAGLARVWTRLEAPYWRSNGFREADAKTLAQLPAALAEQPGPWRCLPLKGLDSAAPSIEKQFALLKAMHQEENERIVRRGRRLVVIVTTLIVLVFGLLTVWAIYVGLVKPRLPRRR